MVVIVGYPRVSRDGDTTRMSEVEKVVQTFPVPEPGKVSTPLSKSIGYLSLAISPTPSRGRDRETERGRARDPVTTPRSHPDSSRRSLQRDSDGWVTTQGGGARGPRESCRVGSRVSLHTVVRVCDSMRDPEQSKSTTDPQDTQTPPRGPYRHGRLPG